LHSKILSEPTLVGREEELAQLELYLNHATEGKGTTIFVSGEAGAGKTRLIETFVENAKNIDVAVLSGWCLSEATAPYFPFIEAFNTYYTLQSKKDSSFGLRQTEFRLSLGEKKLDVDEESGITETATRSMPQKRIGMPDSFSPQVWKDQAFAKVASILNSISTEKPLILFLEDIHWADSASLALLHYISRVIKNSERVMLLATFRSDELTADAEGHPHPLAEVMRMMKREDLYTEIKLSNLNQADVKRIAESMVGGSIRPQLAEKLTVESKGNPLFIVESLRMLHERQSLKLENNQWRLTADELGLPNKIKDVILRRIAVLKYSQRRVLDAAAVIGEKFDIDLLSSVLGMDTLEVLETLNMVAHTTRLVSVEENYYKFDHERSRVTLYEELASPLKQGYHAKIAEKLESTKGAPPPFSDLAFHYAQAGKKEKALKYALDAAKDALARFSNKQAIQHFKYVLQNTEEEQTEQRNIALEGLGDAYTSNQMYGEAIKTFTKLADSEKGLLRLRALRKATDAAFYKWDEPDILLEYAKKAEELAPYNRLEMARIINNRGRAFSWAGRGDFKMDLADYNKALKIFEEENSLADVAEALSRSGLITAGVGNVEKGISRILRSIAIFQEIGDNRKEAEAALFAGQIFYGLGFYSESRRKHVAVLKIGEKLGMFNELTWASSGLSLINEHEEHLNKALSQALKAIEHAKKTDAMTFIIEQQLSLVRLYSKLGDLNQADKNFKTMMKNAPRALKRFQGSGAQAFNLINTTKAVYLAAKGQFKQSNKVFENHFKLLNEAHTVAGYEVRIREDFMWVLEKQGKLEEAKIQREKVKKLLKQASEQLEHANVSLDVMAPRKIQVGEEFEIRVDLVNVGRNAATLSKIEGVIPSGFEIVHYVPFCSFKSGKVVIKEKTVGPFQVETIKLKLKATKTGSYNINPKVTYLNELGQSKTSVANAFNISADLRQPTFEVLPGRMPTGFMELDRLLLGGIPENYAVVLTGSPSDERAFLIKSFLEAGTAKDEIVFYVTTEADELENLLENPNFHLFLCNPKPKTKVPDLSNVTKLRSITDLTNLNISLLKAYRNIDQAKKKRICFKTVSHVLLNYEAKATCKWILELTTDLSSKGFTMLAVLDPSMHPPDQANAVVNSFDGEISLTQTEDPSECRKSLRVKRLKNQEYLKNSICLTT